MSDEFTPQVRALLDRLDPPPLPADFADRLVAKAQATPNLPPLPPLRRRHARRGRRVALAMGVAGLVSVAAAAAVVPADVWRKLPVIGGIVELISPAKNAPAPAPPRIEPAPAVPEASQPIIPEASPRAEQSDARPDAEQAQPLQEERAVVPRHESVGMDVGSSAGQSDPMQRAREALPPLVREMPEPERPATANTREESATVVDTSTEPAPVRAAERIVPASETRQQIRERATTTRQTTRERIERRERRTSRTN